PGPLQIRPAELLLVGGAITLAFRWCKHCLPPWEISYIPIDQPPWNAVIAGKGERFQCPGCGGRVAWHMHGKSWEPTASVHHPFHNQGASTGASRCGSRALTSP